MLDEERVILMTKLSSYEKTQGKKSFDITKYFRSDYVVSQLLKSVFCSSICFVLCLGMYVLCNFETLAEDLYKMDLIAYGKNILKYYVITVIVYGLICYGISSYRYYRAKKDVKNYARGLKMLYSLYKK